MNPLVPLTEAFAWCMLQVTLFSLAAAGAYGLRRRLTFNSATTLLAVSLGCVGLLTLCCVSPWPRWGDVRFGGARSSALPIAVGEAAADQETEITGRDSNVDPKGAVFLSTARRAPDFQEPAANAQRLTSVTQPLTEQLANGSPGWQNVLAMFAATAGAIGLARLTIAVVALRHYRRSSVPIEYAAVHQLLAELTRQCGVRRRVSLRESRLLPVAAMAGWRRPIILLPASWRAWSPDELRAVLAHELAHVARRHFPAWALCQLPLVAHYYHPLVHWLVRRLRLEQELAADALAARLFGSRQRYAAVLAGLALDVGPARTAFSPLGLFMSRPLLMRRLAMLRHPAETASSRARHAQLLVPILLVTAALAVSGLRSSTAEEAEQPTTSTVREVAGAPAKHSPTTESQPTATTAAPPSTVPLTQPGLLMSPYVFGDVQKSPEAIALFLVSRSAPSLTGHQSQTDYDAEWQVLCKTQLALLKSHLVLSSALRQPEIAALPLVREQKDPESWLARKLKVGFVPGSEIMYLKIEGDGAPMKQLTKLVDAVAQAYLDEVVDTEKQRQLASRDLLAENLAKLKAELSEKMAVYYDLARELGMPDSGSGRVAQELDMRRLDRIETEIMRLENAFLELQASGQRNDSQFYEQRIKSLAEQGAELEERILKRGETSVELVSRFRELERLERITDEMAIKLEMTEVEANAPDRIRLIQPAVATGLDLPAK